MSLQVGHDAVRRLNDQHAGQLLDIARALTGHTDAVAARAAAVDDAGVSLLIETAGGHHTTARVEFTTPASGARRRLAFRALAQRAAELLHSSPPEDTPS